MGGGNGGGFLGGLFDFNGDGKTDIGEEWLAFKMFEEMSKEEDNEEDIDDLDFWQLSCRDGSEYGLDPYDFPSEALYNRALEKAEYEELHKYDWRYTCDENKYGIDPEDFETEEDYDEAVEEREENWAEYLSDEVLQKAGDLGISPDNYYDEKEFLDAVEQAGKNTQRVIVRFKSVAKPNDNVQ